MASGFLVGSGFSSLVGAFGPLPASVSWRPVPSPVALSGVVPVPGAVASAALVGGASFFGVRPSSRSFSGWVAVVWFRCPVAARRFSRSVVSSSGVAAGVPFVFVRSCGSWWVVSVPVFVRSFSFVAGSSVPLSVWRL